MKRIGILFLLILTLPVSSHSTAAQTGQRIQLGDVLILGVPSLSEGADSAAFATFLSEDAMPAWNAQMPEFAMHAFQADRGERSGEFLLAWSGAAESRGMVQVREASVLLPEAALEEAGLTSDRGTSFVGGPWEYGEYELVGSGDDVTLPAVELLGIHKIQIIPDRVEAFDAFVLDSLYEAMADRTPGMHLLYYKGVRGTAAGSYMALFAIETLAARELYWPTGAPETEALSEAFRPLKPIADALTRYQVPGSYLEADTGAAAAVFESLDWTDYVHLRAR